MLEGQRIFLQSLLTQVGVSTQYSLECIALFDGAS